MTEGENETQGGEELLQDDNSQSYDDGTGADDAQTEHQDDGGDDDSGDDADNKPVTRAELNALGYSIREIKTLLKNQGQKGEKTVENKGKVATTETNVDDALLSRLEARGYTNAEQQEYAINFSKKIGMHPVEALNDPDVGPTLKAKLEGIKKRQDTGSAMPETTGRPASQPKNSVEYHVKKFKETGELPPSGTELFTKVNKAIQGVL